MENNKGLLEGLRMEKERLARNHQVPEVAGGES